MFMILSHVIIIIISYGMLLQYEIDNFDCNHNHTSKTVIINQYDIILMMI